MQLIHNRRLCPPVAGAALLVCAVGAAAQPILYVDDDAPPGGDGLTWDTAFCFLQDALLAAQPGTGVQAIHIAQGLYRPDRDEQHPQGTGDRHASFTLIDGVSLMGGYAGIGANDPDERDIPLFITTLSGDLAGDDGQGHVGHEENSYHVTSSVAGDNEATLDGCTVTAGYALDFHAPTGSGAGLFNDGGTVFIDHCTFTGNLARHYGGGIYSTDGYLSLDASTFHANQAYGEEWTDEADGGGVWSTQGVLLVTGCTFSDNITGQQGGGLYTDTDVALVTDCLFHDNVAGQPAYEAYGYGAGLASTDSDISVTDCAFIGNTAHECDGGGGSGGGVSIINGTAEVSQCSFQDNWAQLWGGGLFSDCPGAVVSNCTFVDNDAIVEGGGVCAYSCAVLQRCTFLANTGPGGGAAVGGILAADCLFVRNTALYCGALGWSPGDLINCMFYGNSAEKKGGAICLDWASPPIVNCAFIGNTAPYGGAIFSYHADPDLINCTFTANQALDGGGIYNDEASANPTVTNCILWANHADEGEAGIGGEGAASVGYTDLEEYDPLFQHEPDPGADGQWGTEDDDYGDVRLSAGSPCIDAGNNEAVPEEIVTDLDGHPRFIDDPDTDDTGFGDPPIVDMGAYEFQIDACPADITGDGIVDVLDLLAVLAAWGQTGELPEDITGDGVVDVLDLLQVLSAWGPCA